MIGDLQREMTPAWHRIQRTTPTGSGTIVDFGQGILVAMRACTESCVRRVAVPGRGRTEAGQIFDIGRHPMNIVVTHRIDNVWVWCSVIGDAYLGAARQGAS